MTKKWEGLHPVLVRRLMRVHAAMHELGLPMFLTDGVRTTEEQQALYALGRTKPGRIVTNADGVRVKSNHQIKEDGFGHAADCAFMDPDGDGPMTPWNVPDSWWDAYGSCARAVGLRWGIRLNENTVDRPHVELPRVV